MKKYSSILAVIAVILSGYYFYSCNDAEEVINSTTQTFDAEGTAIKQVVEISSLCTDAASYLIALSNGKKIDTVGCPTVSTDTIAKKFTVDYGNSPCTPYHEGVKRSGSYTVNYFVNSSADSITGRINYNNYKVYKKQNDTAFIKITGNDDMSIKMDSVTKYDMTLIANNTMNFSDGRTGSVVLNQLINVSVNNILLLTDDVYKFYGTGTVTANGNSFGYNIYDANNKLEIYGDCYYPKRGLVKLIYNSADFDVDFQPENGACDAIVRISKYGISATLDFSKF